MEIEKIECKKSHHSKTSKMIKHFLEKNEDNYCITFLASNGNSESSVNLEDKLIIDCLNNTKFKAAE